MLRRMHNVIVLSGISLGTACSGQISASEFDAQPSADAGDAWPQEGIRTQQDGGDAWVHEGPMFIDAADAEADVWTHEGIDASLEDVWPHEGPTTMDAGEADAWPHEGPPPLDGGSQ